jgi:hypothetical protein
MLFPEYLDGSAQTRRCSSQASRLGVRLVLLGRQECVALSIQKATSSDAFAIPNFVGVDAP